MKNRIVKLITPIKSNCNNLINISKSRVPISATTKTIYDTVDYFENNIFLKDELKIETKPVRHKTDLKNIINLHNDDGIKDVAQIKRMVQKIEFGNDILHNNKMPNIKLVKTAAAEWVLFDGHHSLLAYMLAGKKYLHEVPQLVVLDEEKGYVSAEEILVFFGEHSKKLKGSAWRKKVVNWQATKEKQLGQRIQANMGELLKSIIFF